MYIELQLVENQSWSIRDQVVALIAARLSGPSVQVRCRRHCKVSSDGRNLSRRQIVRDRIRRVRAEGFISSAAIARRGKTRSFKEPV